MNSRRILFVLGVALLLAGCTTRPILNVTDQPVVTTAGKPVSPDQFGNAIVKAGNSLGWVMTPVSPGLVNGRLALRDHLAVVDVRYTATTYHITSQDKCTLIY